MTSPEILLWWISTILSFSYWEDLSAYVGFHSSNTVDFITPPQAHECLVIPLRSFVLLSQLSIHNKKAPLISMVTGQGSYDHMALAQTLETEQKEA